MTPNPDNRMSGEKKATMDLYEQRMAITEALRGKSDFPHIIAHNIVEKQCLNAMHEAENELTTEQGREYVRTLFQITESDFRSHCATASQRAEAFLRALGLWKPQP